MATIMNKSLMFIIVISLCLLVLNVQVTKANDHLPKFKQAVTKQDGSLSFLVIGDWGRKGEYNQTLVASQMGKVGDDLDVDFIISTGDNFYEDGLTGVDDPAFAESFTNIYTAPSLQKKWFNVLGNHDYRGNVLAQLSPALRKLDSRFIIRRSYVVETEIVDFIFVDTSPFQDKYFTEKEHKYDWRGVRPRQLYLSKLLKGYQIYEMESSGTPSTVGQTAGIPYEMMDSTGYLVQFPFIFLQQVDDALKKSTANWKFVVGHHTLMSAGSHGNTEELVSQLLPILKANDVDLYINGHDHCLQQISSPDSPLQFLTSGGGSKAWRGEVTEWNPPEELKLYYDGQGFMSMQVTSTKIDVVFYDVFGQVVHSWSRTKPGTYESS